jgi:hypothetical protein
MQQRLKSVPRTARAGIVSTEFFDQLDITMDEAQAALHMRFGGITPPPL